MAECSDQLSLVSTVSAIEQEEVTSWKHHLLRRETELLCFLFAQSQWVRQFPVSSCTAAWVALSICTIYTGMHDSLLLESNTDIEAMRTQHPVSWTYFAEHIT